MHTVIDALVVTGHLPSQADAFAPTLEDLRALEDVLRHVVGRVTAGAISARHATTLVARLPVILERTGIDPAPLRELVAEVDELRQHGAEGGMPKDVRRLCRALIERRSFRNRFLLAHAPARRVAQALLDRARAEGCPLTPAERGAVIRHGAVALFCAIEIGGAPVRVENVLEMSYGTGEAWLRPKGQGFAVNIPGHFVKNGKPIEFEMKPDAHRFCDTVHWYLAQVRPLILTDPRTEEERASPWLLPMLSDASRPCPYETFLMWFTRIMRDEVKVPCTPHNFRHGQASLLYHRHPDRIGWIARRLGDKDDTVLRYYAWVHNDLVMAEGQRLIAGLIQS